MYSIIGEIRQDRKKVTELTFFFIIFKILISFLKFNQFDNMIIRKQNYQRKQKTQKRVNFFFY